MKYVEPAPGYVYGAPAWEGSFKVCIEEPVMNMDLVPVGDNPPYEVNVLIEIPLGGNPVKYEVDKKSGAIFVDRFLHTAMYYPINYGFIPHTLSDGGDPVDVMVVGNRPLIPGAVVGAQPIGVLLMEDEAGLDEKILAVPAPRLTRFYSKINHYEDLPEILIERISHFFSHYKDLEPDKWVKLVGWRDPEDAEALILKGIEAAKG